MFLQVITDYWSDRWAIERIEIPRALPKKHSGGREIGDRNKEIRKNQIKDAAGRSPVEPFPFRVDMFSAAPGERRLYAAMITQAIMDWSRFSVCAYHFEQRIALNAYWWVMGFEPLAPPGLKDEDWEKIENGEQRQYRVPRGENPFEYLKIPKSVLWELQGLDATRTRNTDEELLDSASFQCCCEIVDVDPYSIRTRMHLVPPS